MQFIQTEIFHPQKHLFPLTKKPAAAAPAQELFAYWVNDKGLIVVPDEGCAGNWTFFAKAVRGRGLTRGNRVRTRPASWYKTRQEALVALNAYGPTRGWRPCRTYNGAVSVACSCNR